MVGVLDVVHGKNCFGSRDQSPEEPRVVPHGAGDPDTPGRLVTPEPELHRVVRLHQTQSGDALGDPRCDVVVAAAAPDVLETGAGLGPLVLAVLDQVEVGEALAGGLGVHAALYEVDAAGGCPEGAVDAGEDAAWELKVDSVQRNWVWLRFFVDI